MSRKRAYIMPFDASGNRANWVEVTRETTLDGISNIKRTLEGSEFDVGVLRNSSVNLTVKNDQGRFSEVGGVYSIFQWKRADSRVKITWDRANYDFVAGISKCGQPLHQENTVFEGLLQDDGARMSILNYDLGFAGLGRESVFERALVPFDQISNGDTISEILLACLDQVVITDLLTVSASNISLTYDAVVDDVSKLENKTVREALAQLLPLGVAVLYIENDSVIIAPRTAGADVEYNFYGQGSQSGRENIITISNIKSGLNRLFNFVTWKDTTLFAQNVSTIDRYGYRKKEIESDLITTDATRQAILDAIVAEFGEPKQEFDLTCPMTNDVLALPLLARVSIDYPTPVVSRNDAALYEVSEYEVAEYAKALEGFSILSTEHYKILGVELNLKDDKVTFQMREI